MPVIGWTKEAVDTANTNRDGTGTVVELLELTSAQYIDRVECFPLGTNVQTEGVILASNGQGLANPRNNYLVGRADLQATTAGAPAAGDTVTFTIHAWLPEGTILYALVHDAQASGRSFTAYGDSTYQVYES